MTPNATPPAPAPTLRLEDIPDSEPSGSTEGMPPMSRLYSFQPYTLERAREEARAAGVGLSTGFTRLDACDLRWRAGKLYAVVGRPGEGKTTLLLELLMRHVERRAETEPAQRELGAADEPPRAPAVFVTYEENLHHIYLRLLLREAARARHARRKGAPIPRAVGEQWLRTGVVRDQGDAAVVDAELRAAAQRLDEFARRGLLALVDGDAEGGEIDELLANLGAASLAAGAPSSMTVIDYYQKIRVARDLRGGSRQEQLQDVADRLRRFAKGEYGRSATEHRFATPVLVGAQVNREAAATGGQSVQPELHHIREADDLANDAAGVLTLFRPADVDGGELRVKIVKNRDGRRGDVVSLGFHGAGGFVDDAPTVMAPARGGAVLD